MKSRKVLFVPILFVLAASAGWAQSTVSTGNIRAEVALINRDAPKYRKRSMVVEGISLEGAQATYFTSGLGLRKITAKLFGETFRATAELYYSNGELIFAYQKLEGYDTHIAMDPPPKVIKVAETRVYYSHSRAVKIVEGKKQLNASSAEFKAAEEGINDLSVKLRAAASL